jgi:hypothetical protein
VGGELGMDGGRRRTWVSSCAAEVVVVGESSEQQPLVSDGLSAPETTKKRRERKIHNRGLFLLVACAAYERLKPKADQNRRGYPAPHVTRHTSHVTRHTSHGTRHTSHVTRHTSHVTRHITCTP